MGKEYNEAYRLLNREKLKLQARQYRLLNSEILNKKGRAKYWKNRAAISQKRKNLYYGNGAYRKKNIANASSWAARNRQRVNANRKTRFKTRFKTDAAYRSEERRVG